MIAFRTTPRLTDLCIQTPGLSPTRKTDHPLTFVRVSRVLRLKAINLDCQQDIIPIHPVQPIQPFQNRTDSYMWK